MEWLDRLAEVFGLPAPDLWLVLTYYAWMIGPVVVAFVLITVVVMKVLPRQRRREDLSGQDRRIR